MSLVNKKSFLLLCSFLMILLFITGCNATTEYVSDISYKSIKNMVAEKEDFILYVGNKSCPHCKIFEPKFRKVVNEQKIKAYKLDTATLTNDEYNEFVGLVGSLGTPTVLFFYNGEESGTANRIDGDVSEQKIIDRLKANEYIKD